MIILSVPVPVVEGLSRFISSIDFGNRKRSRRRNRGVGFEIGDRLEKASWCFLSRCGVAFFLFFVVLEVVLWFGLSC